MRQLCAVNFRQSRRGLARPAGTGPIGHANRCRKLRIGGFAVTEQPGFVRHCGNAVRTFNQTPRHQLAFQRFINDGLDVRNHLRSAGFGGALIESRHVRILLRTQRFQMLRIRRRDGGQFLGLFHGLLQRRVVQIVCRIGAGAPVAGHGDGDVLPQAEGRRGDAVVGESRVRLLGRAHRHLTLGKRRKAYHFLGQFLRFVFGKH